MEIGRLKEGFQMKSGREGVHDGLLDPFGAPTQGAGFGQTLDETRAFLGHLAQVRQVTHDSVNHSRQRLLFTFLTQVLFYKPVDGHIGERDDGAFHAAVAPEWRRASHYCVNVLLRASYAYTVRQWNG